MGSSVHICRRFLSRGNIKELIIVYVRISRKLASGSEILYGRNTSLLIRLCGINPISTCVLLQLYGDL